MSYLYGRRFAKRAMDRRVKAKVETRDAIVWDIDESTKTCRIKIQGSDKFVIAHFPRNWKTTPYWLKSRNAVIVRHRGGVRGYVEVIGEGRAIPTPIGEQMMPDPQALPDGFITGGKLYETTSPSMSLIATAGTYRIDGKVYYFDPESASAIVMNDPAPMVMGGRDVMGVLEYNVTVDTAPAVGYFRYDAFVVGTDGVVDYLKGDVSKTPVKPTIPASHVLIGDYIFVIGGETTIETNDIGAEWTAPKAAKLDLDIEGSGLSYTLDYNSLGSGYAYVDISVTVKDQYDNPFPATYNGHLIKITKESGAGEFYSAETGWHSTTVQQHCTTGYDGFQYRIEQNPGPADEDKVVTFTVSLEGATGLQIVGIIILHDVPA